jgi:hypothetical protein
MDKLQEFSLAIARASATETDGAKFVAVLVWGPEHAE